MIAKHSTKFSTIARQAGVKSRSELVAIADDLGLSVRFDDKGDRYLDEPATVVAMFVQHVEDLYA